MLYMFQKVYMGDVDKEENRNLPQLHWQEIAVLVPILIAIILIGLQPAPFFSTMNSTVNELVEDVQVYIPGQADTVVFEQPADAASVVLNSGE